MSRMHENRNVVLPPPFLCDSALTDLLRATDAVYEPVVVREYIEQVVTKKVDLAVRTGKINTRTAAEIKETAILQQGLIAKAPYETLDHDIESFVASLILARTHEAQSKRLRTV